MIEQTETTATTANQNSKKLTEKAAAEYLGVSPITLQRRRSAGQIAFYRIFGRVFYSLEQLDEFIASCERKAK